MGEEADESFRGVRKTTKNHGKEWIKREKKLKRI
jgi:hypothetical protein